MAKRKSNVLVIGSRAEFGTVFDRLEATRNYRFAYAADLRTARPHLRKLPDAILLRLPEDQPTCEQALAWVETMKGRRGVVVLSCEQGMRYYLAAMEHGAFDYVTCRTPFEEIVRVLDKATIRRTRRAA